MPYPRLDADAEQVVKKLSQQIAQEQGLDFVGTEHILLAILRHNRGISAEVLHEFGISEERVSHEIERLMEKGKEETWVLGRLPGSPHYRNVVALAIDEATQLESQHIGSEHLLLGLLREKGSTAQRVLSKLGLTLEKCRQKILKRLA
jgi:ATP-dependent Clp protease ATP-binding subunit ClpC